MAKTENAHPETSITASCAIAVLGCGMWGRNLIRNLKRLGVLKTVCDHHAERADAYAAEFECAAASFDAILNDEEITGIVLATSAPSHAELACAALKSGKHVFIEKPMALELEDAEKIASTAQQQNKQVMIGHLIRYHPAFQTLKRQVDEGLIGNIRHIQANRLAMGRIRSSESVLFDLCPHDISLILALTKRKMPEQLNCHTFSHITENIADIATTSMRFSHTLSAQMQTGWIHPVKEHKLSVTGEKGTLIFDDTLGWENKLVYYQDDITQIGEHFTIDRKTPVSIPVEPAEPLYREMEEFITVCTTHRNALTDAAEGLAVQQVLAQMQQAITDLSPAQKMTINSSMKI